MTRILVAGATGAIGRRLVPQLLAAGHQVTATTRSAEKAAALRALGVQSAVIDVFDAPGLTTVLQAAQPEVVIHQLTDLPANPDPSQAAEFAARNARIRNVGTANLVGAAARAGAGRIIAQSIAWAYAPGDTPRTESDALDVAATGTRAVSVGGVVALETAILGCPGLVGVVLRYGALYGPGTGSAAPKPGLPAVHVDAAARAALLALAAPARGLYNIVDAGPAVTAERARRELAWDPAYRLDAD